MKYIADGLIHPHCLRIFSFKGLTAGYLHETYSLCIKQSVLIFLLLLLSSATVLLAENNREIQSVIHEKWEMSTDAGFGYSLKFNNDDNTFLLDYRNEGIAVIHPRIKGTFVIDEGKGRPVITLVFRDFKISYYYKLPSHYYATLPEDQLTEKEVKMCNTKGYVDRTTLFVKNVEIINRNIKLPFYYEHLKEHFFVENDR